ncbi:hypothetical protein B0H16DRAFT_1728701 [Mycena metata]|uniref:Uncharacterized protein n=1 Tax=Mycena metata TaxID=1033252 RepID=A0AAD7N0C1_9AGAR|nr:hypothetical protein B0H16DRAFT_1728701 [Mycena metata]
MDPRWPSVKTLPALLSYLGHVATPTLANSEYGVDFINPVKGSRVADDTVFTNLDAQPCKMWVYGSVASRVSRKGGNLVLRIKSPNDPESSAIFQQQLNSLARPVIWHDKADESKENAVLVQTCTDTDRETGDGGSWVDVHLEYGGKQMAEVSVRGEEGYLATRPYLIADFPLFVGDTVLLWVSLHQRESWSRNHRDFELLATHVRVIQLEETGPQVVAEQDDESKSGSVPSSDETVSTLASDDGNSPAKKRRAVQSKGGSAKKRTKI